MIQACHVVTMHTKRFSGNSVTLEHTKKQEVTKTQIQPSDNSHYVNLGYSISLYCRAMVRIGLCGSLWWLESKQMDWNGTRVGLTMESGLRIDPVRYCCKCLFSVVMLEKLQLFWKNENNPFSCTGNFWLLLIFLGG